MLESHMSEKCTHPQFFQIQAEQLRRCIDEHKWYLSERAHHDVGWKVAQDDFIKVYFQGFAAGFRASFCGLVCQNRESCATGARYMVNILPKSKVA